MLVQNNKIKNLKPAQMLVIAVLFFLAVYFGLIKLTPPQVISADSEPTVFSAERAQSHLKIIAERPHMVGSKDHERVRNYISAELQLMGLQTEVQATTATYEYSKHRHNTLRFAKVKNIVAVLKGSNRKLPAVALMSHYDSVPTASGAGDAGAGVAAILETLRALQNEQELLRDVIVIITDAEEVGLLGAQGFFKYHPLAKEIGLVMNFEARGTAGSAQMFETSPGNAWLIQEYAKAAKYPAASSISYEVYKRMPNDTDVSIIKNKGYQILNFGFVDNAFDYHSPTDTPENLDLRSLQHHGVQALSLVKHFANLNEWQQSSENRTYFNVSAAKIISYPTSFALISGLLVLSFAMYTLYVGVQLKRFSLNQLAFALLALLLMALLIFLISYNMFESFKDPDRPKNLRYRFHFLMLIYGLFMLFLTSLTSKILLRWISADGLVAAAWLLMSIGMAVTLFAVPNASYIFTWAIVFLLIGQLFVWRTQYTFWPMAIASLLCVYFWVHLLYMIYLGVGLTQPSLFSPLVLLIIFQLMIILIRIPMKISLMVMTVCFLAAYYNAFATDYSERKPRPTEVFYYQDNITKKSYWASRGENRDLWAKEFFPAGDTNIQNGKILAPFGYAKVQLIPTKNYTVNTSTIKLTDRKVFANRLRIEFDVTPSNRTEMGQILLQSKAQIIGLTVDERSFDLVPFKHNENGIVEIPISYYGLGLESIHVVVELAKNTDLTVLMGEYQGQWPDGFSVPERPDNIAPISWGFSDSTLVTHKVEF